MTELINYKSFISFLNENNLYNKNLPTKTIYKKAKIHIIRKQRAVEFYSQVLKKLPPLGVVNHSMMVDLHRINKSIFGAGAIICELIVEDCKIKVKMKNTKISSELLPKNKSLFKCKV